MKTKSHIIRQSLVILGFSALVIISITCQKDYDLPTGNNKVVLNASTTDSVSYFTVKVQSRLANTANYTISDHGLCWGLEPNPKISDNKISNGYTAQPIDISASLKNLLPGKKYYIRSFATIPTGTVYGAQNEFTTLKTGIPVSVTDTITDITYTTALCKGIVLADSGLMVTKRGICWSLTPNPTLTSNFDTLGKGLGVYDIQIDALNPSSTYYIRAFAVNDSGTSYGIQKSFITVALTPPTLTTTPITNITTTTAESGGNITADGGSPITARGICWSILPNPTTLNSHTIDGTETGLFTSSLTALTPNTSYYVRAYATNALGTSYGDPLSFSTNVVMVPSLTTADINNITVNTAGSGGNVTSDGGTAVSARGVCWSTTANPSITNSHTTDGSGTGTFVSSLTGLTTNTLYHIRAYATNSIGTSYGSDLTFTTLTNPVAPTVTTASATNIAQTTATSGGNVTSDGGTAVSARGVCWSTNQTPTTADSHTTDGTGTGTYVSSITGLNAATTYYIRAYATNSVGTAYGNQQSFTTSAWSQLLYEGFNYPTPAFIGGNGDPGSTSNNWTTNSVTAGQTTTIDVQDGSLSYSGLQNSLGNKVFLFSNANAVSRDVNRGFTSTATTLYFSALINIIDNTQITALDNYFMHFGAAQGAINTTFGGRLGAKIAATTSNFRFIIVNNSGGTPVYSDNGADLNFGTTYLVVVKYDISAPMTVATMWVNPTSLGGAEPAGGITNNTGTNAFPSFSTGSICLRNNATTPKAHIDEIRVGETWASVTP